MAKIKKLTSAESSNSIRKSTTPEAYRETRKKLEETPFSSVNEMNKASRELQLMLWKRLENARLLRNLMDTESFKFVKEELNHGVSCKYGSDQEDLVRVFSDGVGIKIAINPNLANEVEKSESYIESIIRATAEPFAKSFYQMKGMLPSDGVDAVDSAMKGKK